MSQLMKQVLTMNEDSANYQQRGFFLLEMSIALAVCIVSISLLVPSTFFFYKTLIDIHIEHIKTVCYYLHHKAIIEQQPLKMVIDLAHHTIHTPYGIITLQAGVVFGCLPLLLGPPSRPHLTINKACSFINDTIYFYPDGTASAGALYFIDTHAQWQHALTISIDKWCCIRKYAYKISTHQWHPY